MQGVATRPVSRNRVEKPRTGKDSKYENSSANYEKELDVSFLIFIRLIGVIHVVYSFCKYFALILVKGFQMAEIRNDMYRGTCDDDYVCVCVYICEKARLLFDPHYNLQTFFFILYI